MYCIKCGKEIPDNSLFCPFCGSRQDAGTREEQGAPAPSANTAGSAGAGMDAAQKGPAYDRPINDSPIRKAQYNLLCILGLVISLISLVFNYFGLVGLGGIIVSVIGLVLCGRRKENGRILGVLGVFFGAFSLIYAIMAMVR